MSEQTRQAVDDYLKVADKRPGHNDALRFDHSVFVNFAAVQSHMADDGLGNVVITLNPADTITIQHLTVSQLHASDFLFA